MGRRHNLLHQRAARETEDPGIAGIAQDFNNMLTGIIGAINLMRRRIAAERYDDLGRFMEAAPRRRFGRPI